MPARTSSSTQSSYGFADRLANVRRNLAATRTTPGRAYTRSGLTAVEALIASSAGSMGMRF